MAQEILLKHNINGINIMRYLTTQLLHYIIIYQSRYIGITCSGFHVVEQGRGQSLIFSTAHAAPVTSAHINIRAYVNPTNFHGITTPSTAVDIAESCMQRKP